MARRLGRSRNRRSRSSNRFRDYGGDDWGGWGGFPPYVSAAERRAQAQRRLAGLRKAGGSVSPVVIAGRAIATTFWGRAWCDNLERYSDYANRIPRGRSYVRNGSVVDLQIGPGRIDARVSGSSLYSVEVTVKPVPAPRWKAICQQCAGSIDSLVELLQGRLSAPVMAHICQQGTGLFPSPAEIEFSCSCPDWASMCKHVAAVLYGVGARLDHQPALLFRLRKVDELDLVTRAGAGAALGAAVPSAARVLTGQDLGEVFGVELAPGLPAESRASGASKTSRTSGESRASGASKTSRATAPRGKAKGVPRAAASKGARSRKKRAAIKKRPKR